MPTLNDDGRMALSIAASSDVQPTPVGKIVDEYEISLPSLPVDGPEPYHCTGVPARDRTASGLVRL